MTTRIELKDAHVAYRRKMVVRGVSFCIEPGAIGCLLGPSGCGKTTVLRAVAGFEPLARGSVSFDGEIVSRPGFTLAPEARRLGMVFQDFALFPHLNVADNVGFGLRGLPAQQRRLRVTELLALVGLSDCARFFPHQLSGGQQQRIALARALAPRPRLLLLDEPFSSMDVDLREGLAREVRSILKREGITGILVTHDQHEAFAMADEVGVMRTGQIQQWDTAYRIYHQPANRFIADFIGQGVLLPGRVLGGSTVATELGIIPGRIPEDCKPDCPVEILIRPDDIILEQAGNLAAEVVEKAFRGSHFLYTLRLPSGARVLSLAPSHYDHALGERIGIRLEIDHLVMFPRGGGPPPE